MAMYKMIVTVSGSNIVSVEKKAKVAFGDNLVTVHKVDLAKSRADRLQDIAGEVSNAASDVEELKGELEEWLESLPENLQGGSKGEELSEAIDALEELKTNLEDIDFSSISFPSMMG